MVNSADARSLLDTVLSLDWAEATPDSNGRDGVVLSGGVLDKTRSLEFTTWSPEFQSEPAKCEFFWMMWRFVKQSETDLSIDLKPVDRYLSQPTQKHR